MKRGKSGASPAEVAPKKSPKKSRKKARDRDSSEEDEAVGGEVWVALQKGKNKEDSDTHGAVLGVFASRGGALGACLEDSERVGEMYEGRYPRKNQLARNSCVVEIHSPCYLVAYEWCIVQQTVQP